MTAVDSAPVEATAISSFSHRDAMTLQGTEFQRSLDVMRSLDDHAWTAPTDCPDWDVRRLYLHVLGACESGASMRVLAHQMRVAMRDRRADGGPLEAALSALQVRERLALTPPQLITRFADVAPRTVRSRTRMPALLRKARMKVDGPVFESWSLGYLIDTIYLRDAWMHRVDVTRAADVPMVLTPEHDGRIVADVVAEWARRHGRPFDLRLTGPAGGWFRVGTDPQAPTYSLDAVEFCRTLAGRAPGEGLLTTVVPF
jgi:uncharacterized protein (TIGR03083 family)